MKNIDSLIEKIYRSVEKHYLGNGAYKRFLLQDEKNTRSMDINEYGCADAINILYSINRLPKGDEREKCIRALQGLQKKDSGLFEEKTHHFIHTTAHCIAALEIFDAEPLYPQREMLRFFTKEGISGLHEEVNWAGNPWGGSHLLAGAYVVGVLTDNVDSEWQSHYFSLLYDNTDPVYGMSRKGTIDPEKNNLHHHLNGWFHYMFNMEYAKRPLKHPEKLIDTCIMLYDEKKLGDTFGKNVGFAEVDWVFALNRATRQTPHRFDEAKARLRDFALSYIDFLESTDLDTHDRGNDLHSVFGAVCCLAELQTALPGEYISSRPLRLVLDRRPFI